MLFSKTHSFHSYYYFTLSYIYYSHLLNVTELLLGETFKWVSCRVLQKKTSSLEIFSPLPIAFIIISTIYSFLFILSLHCSLGSFFLSFFLSSMILCLCGGLHSPLLKKFHPRNFGSCLGFTPNLTRHILISSSIFLFNHVSCVCVDLGTYKHLLALILVNGFLYCQPL